MFKNHTSTNRTLALFTFIVSLILYLSTMAPTASFWDAGEFIAVAHGLQVNHPPGAPFYSLLGRMFSMFMPAEYVAASINFVSVLSSALTVTLLYLVIVRLVREWKNYPSNLPTFDQIGMYGGALIGALTFAVTDTFWFNAVEAEVYALSMFFTAIVVWLALVWAENHEEPYNERWLLLIAYLFGIALGIHLLNLLAMFFVGLIIYFKKYEFSYSSFGIAALVTTVTFLLLYPFTILYIPSIMDGITQSTYGLIGPTGFIILVILMLSGGIYYTQKKKMRMANMFLIGYALILVGYSSYSLVFIRSGANPPIDMNNPETVDSFIDYLGREQYGDTPLLSGYTFDNSIGTINREEKSLFPRRYSTRPQHIQQYAKYSSDLDYFIRYQVNHMYWRYFAWNFIGRDADVQDASWQSGFTETKHEDNPAHNSYFYIPFLLGLFGMLFHFQNDWKRALSVLILFIMTGLAIIFYLNQSPLEPRERDYAYVGSFFAFAIWIGMGGVGIIETIKEQFKPNKAAAYGVLGVLFLASPLLMGVQNYDDHDRSDRYVASDYAYNLLQSVAPNGIIFTNGDNDTFPIWYIQEVEGVRTDVRLVNLSLLNTDWYIKQLRDQWAHEAPPVPISLTDKEIEELTSRLSMHQPDTLRIPVEKDFLREAFSGDDQYKEALGVDTSLQIFDEDITFEIPISELDDEVAWYYKGRSAGQDREGNTRYYTQVQDEVILDILRTNRWLRPIYFANTVSGQSQLNLQPYFRFEGKAFRVVPQRHEANGYGMLDTEIHSERLNSFRFRHWNDPGTYLDENIRRMLGNYRFSVTELAKAYQEAGQPDSATKWLQWGEEHIPFNLIDKDLNSIVLYAYHYMEAGNLENAKSLALKAEKSLMENLEGAMETYDEIQTELVQLNEKAESSGMQERRRLQNRINSIASERQTATREISYAISHLTIVQRIYFAADNDEEALELADRVDVITGQRISLPGSREESKEQVESFNL